jgi:hypothetical protein
MAPAAEARLISPATVEAFRSLQARVSICTPHWLAGRTARGQGLRRAWTAPAGPGFAGLEFVVFSAWCEVRSRGRSVQAFLIIHGHNPSSGTFLTALNPPWLLPRS